MDNKVVSEVEDNSTIGSSAISEFNYSDTTEIQEVSPRLSPLTSSLNQNLTLKEDNVLSPESSMGIENTWTEANTSTSDFPIPLPAPGDLEDYGDLHHGLSDFADSIDTSSGIEHGPFLPSSHEVNNLFYNSEDNQEGSENDPALAGVCGIRNLGNTCFMGAGLQCLTATPPVLRHFLDLQQRGEKLPPPGSLMAHFSTLLSQMWSGRHSVIRPTEFKQTLGAYHSQFKDYRQHDCQEFLACLLDSLHEQMNVAKPAKNCQSMTTITTANSIISQNDRKDSIDSNVTATANANDEFMDCYENSASPECPNSPNVTMAGSPRDLNSPVGDLDSTANSPHGSPLNDEEETLDSNEIVDTNSSFIHNKTQKDGFGTVSFNSRYSKLDELNDLHGVNNYPGLSDILKDAKTSNANFLVTSQECNNEIHYDSQKFPKENIRRMALDNSNLTENHDFDNKSVSVKRINEVNVQKNNCGVECAGVVSSGSETECDSGLEKCNVKRMRLEDQEKNHRRDGLGPSGVQCSRILQNYENGAVASQDEVEADKHWVKHLKSNRSVIVDTFQGQFKSTVVCEVCKHVSVTYEPFMYLSVPLPHAMERQLSVTYVPANNEPPVRCVVSLNKQSRVGKLKEELLKCLDKEHIALSSIALAEVLEDHIARILEDNTMLKYVNATNRSIYAFELTDPPDAHTSVPDGGGDRVAETETCQNDTSSTEEVGLCTICLEECDGELKKHGTNNCKFIMCDPCAENYFKTQPAPHNCPVCEAMIDSPSSFMKIDQTGRPRPAIRILNVPLVLRHDTNEATNNRRAMKLFGYPHLVRLPTRVNAVDLYEVVKRVVPQEGEYTVHFVDGQGHHCSRCMYTKHCTGCRVPDAGTVSLQNGDTLAVRYTENIPKVLPPIDHISVTKERPHHPLSLYDCLQAFSQSETLDEHNPWFCPKCEINQCATKTLTVHRYPKFLIVYLKRFVFHECISLKLDDKVTFPLVGLSVGRHLYDLYACVCHFGGVSAGHYTAYARNPRSDVWYYYNDDVTSKKKPHDEDFSNAYILFYSRQQGTNLKPCNI